MPEAHVYMHRSQRNFSEPNRQSVFDVHRDEQRAQRGAFISVGKFIVMSASWSVYTAQSNVRNAAHDVAAT